MEEKILFMRGFGCDTIPPRKELTVPVSNLSTRRKCESSILRMPMLTIF